jgi:predicted NBD/HSP70 family sugar kinase
MRSARSRQDTRSAVLTYLWRSAGSYRTNLAENIELTDASVSRIIAELKSEGVVNEERRTASYQGGPSVFIALSNNIAVAVLEISNNRIHVAVGTLTGDVLYSERYALPDGLETSGVATAVEEAIQELKDWACCGEIAIEQIAVSIPGYHPHGRRNPIVSLDPRALLGWLELRFPTTPIKLVNSMVTRAVAHRLQNGKANFEGSYLFIYIGHDVGGAFVEDIAHDANVEPCEIGHMVVDLHGPYCRCGHAGCLETYVSTAALARFLNVEEPDLIGRGDNWHAQFHISAKARWQIREQLSKLALMIGNTLNARECRKVVLTGWPCVLPQDDHALISEIVDQTILGGGKGVELHFAPANFGKEPASGLALATFSFIQRGGGRLKRLDEVREV